METADREQSGVDALDSEPLLEPLVEDEEMYRCLCVVCSVELDGLVGKDELVPCPQETSSIPCPLTAEHLTQLGEAFDTMVGSDIGVDIYLRTAAFLKVFSTEQEYKFDTKIQFHYWAYEFLIYVIILFK